MKKIFLIFPNQLFKSKHQFKNINCFCFIEDSLFFGCDSERGYKFHCQKIIFHKASMEAYYNEMKKQNHKLIYLQHKRNSRTEDHLNYLLELGYNHYIVYKSDNILLETRLKDFTLKNNCGLEIIESEMFLTDKELEKEMINQKNINGMQKFYKKQRQNLNILIDKDGNPIGGEWSYDKMNRKKLPSKIDVPRILKLKTNKYVLKARENVIRNYSDYYGNHENFNYPTTHEEAEKWLKDFLIERFNLFGDYEDAISSKHRILWHSVLSPLINTGLLTPLEIVEKAQNFYHLNKIGINSFEGFIRQIIGWREFIFIIYKRNNLEFRNGNFWGFDDKPIPSSFYTGETGIRPLDDSIKNILETGYAHHIERLMIIGNFMLLCRFHPKRVYQWFMELFIDSYDWVMVPNVYGMSQFSNGGLFTTKPYISGSNYIKKMSNYSSDEWGDIWDGLFWTFIDDYKNTLNKQHRFSMILRTFEKMDGDKKNKHRENAIAFLFKISNSL